MTVVASFTPSHRDLIWAGIAGMRDRPATLAFWVAFFVLLPWLAAAYFASTQVGFSWAVAVFAVVPFFTIASFVWMPVRLLRKSPTLQGTHTYEFAEEAIRLRGPGFDSRLGWEVLSHCRDYGSTLCFFSGKQAMIIVPVRALPGAEWQALKALVASKGIDMRG